MYKVNFFLQKYLKFNLQNLVNNICSIMSIM